MSCSKCNKAIQKTEFNYSIERYGIILCRDCQKNYINLERKHRERKKKSTPEAIKLCEILIKLGFDAKLEQWDGYKHIDIAIPEYMINIEVDGMQHQYSEKRALSDLKRTYYSFRRGYVTLRIPNKLIQEKVYETAEYIKKFIETSEEQVEEIYDEGDL